MTTTSSQDPRCQQFHQLSGESAVVSAVVVTGRRAPPFSVILCPEKEMFSGTKNVSLVRGLALPCCEHCMAQFYQGLPRAWPFPVAEFVGWSKEESFHVHLCFLLDCNLLIPLYNLGPQLCAEFRKHGFLKIQCKWGGEVGHITSPSASSVHLWELGRDYVCPAHHIGTPWALIKRV